LLIRRSGAGERLAMENAANQEQPEHFAVSAERDALCQAATPDISYLSFLAGRLTLDSERSLGDRSCMALRDVDARDREDF
jgi:hypothetical protein